MFTARLFGGTGAMFCPSSRIVPETFTPAEAVSRAARFLEEQELAAVG